MDGVFLVLAWVVSVMLPPMAIFFPLFTLLEDLGYLPRVAFNLDHAFQQLPGLRQAGPDHVPWALAATPQGWWAAASSTVPGSGSWPC